MKFRLHREIIELSHRASLGMSIVANADETKLNVVDVSVAAGMRDLIEEHIVSDVVDLVEGDNDNLESLLSSSQRSR